MSLPSDKVVRRAAQLIRRRKIKQIRDARVYQVEGDKGRLWTLFIIGHGRKRLVKCECPAGAHESLCAHAVAALATDEPEEDLMSIEAVALGASHTAESPVRRENRSTT